MQLKINTSLLRGCLETVEKALPVRSTIPNINNVLFEINNNNLIFSSTNLEMSIKVNMEYISNNTGKMLLPPKIIDIIRYFPTEEVYLDINWESYRLNISGGSAQFNLFGADSSDYPLSAFEQSYLEASFKIEQRQLKKILKSVIFAASNEETRPAFNGILFYIDQQKLSLTASDTYRLVIHNIRDDSFNFETKKYLVPARSLREILRILEKNDDNIQVDLSGNAISFQQNGNIIMSRLLEEKYPDVSGVIPQNYKTKLKTDKKVLENAISRAALLAVGKNQAVNLVVSDSELVVKVSGEDGSMEEVIPVEKDGENVDLFVNTRFVLDVLKIIDEQSVTIDFHGDSGPLIFRMVDDTNYLYLVLPIKKVN